MIVTKINDGQGEETGLLFHQNESPTRSNCINDEIPLGMFRMVEEQDGKEENIPFDCTEFNELQAESDEREKELLEERRRLLMRLKRMEYKRKIRTEFNAIGTFKANTDATDTQVMGKVSYQPKWTDLHHASARCLVDRIQELVDAGEDPNVIDDRGRTSLDVAGIAFYQGVKIENLYEVLRILLEVGGKFNTMKGNIDSLDTVLHTAVELNCPESIKILLDQGASVACLNSAGVTPLHISIKNQFEEAFKILLTYKCEEPTAISQRANTRDISGFTLLQAAVVTDWVQGVQCLLDARADITASSNLPFEFYNNVTIDDASNLVYRLEQIHETPIHLAAYIGNRHILRKLIANRKIAVNHINHLGQSPLYIAIRYENLSCVETLINMGADFLKVSNENHNVLHVAIQFGFKNIAEFLIDYLDSGIVNTMLSSFNNLGYAPIHTAVASNRVDCIELLGKKHAFFRLKTKGEFIADWTPLHIAAAKNYPEAAEVVLKFDEQAIEDVDHVGRSPVHLAASRCNREVMVVMLRKGAVLSSRTKREKGVRFKKKKDLTALEMISTELPNPTPFFEEVFDSFIDSYDSDLTKESGNLVTMDYGVFTKVDGVSQINVLEELVKCDQRELLIHPLVESLIYLKWRSLLPLFYVIVSIYGFFALSLYGFIIDAFYDENDDTVLRGWMDAIFLTPLILIILLEIVFISVHRARYFYQFENWAKIFSIFCAFIMLAMGSESWTTEGWSRHIATGALLMSWVQIMFLLSRFPYMGFYVLMFSKVSVNILKILITFVFLLIAFSLSFMIQYHSKPPFDGPWAAFIKTIVMMTSEFEYDDLFGKEHSEELADSREFVHIIFILFLIFVSIVFVNFMLGVAVSDVNDLKIDGNIRRLEKQVEYLSTLDLLAYGPIMKRLLSKDVVNRRFIKEIKIKASVTKYWEVLYESKGNNEEINFSQKQISLPSHILDTIFQKIKAKKEQKEEERRTKLYRMQIDMLYKTIIESKDLLPNKLDSTDSRSKMKVKTKFDGAMHLLNDLNNLRNELNIKCDNLKIKCHIADKCTQTDTITTASLRKSI